MTARRHPKPLIWIGRTKKNLKTFPEDVQDALHLAQMGSKHPAAKPLKGFAGAAVLEIADDHEGSTYRAVYTVKLGDVVYALHAFQKKSARGIATPKAEIALIKQRLKEAYIHYEQEIGDSK